MEIKRHWLGKEWYLPGAAGNDIHKVSLNHFNNHLRAAYRNGSQTNVPDIRLHYRHQTLLEELAMIRANTAHGHVPESRGGVMQTDDVVAARAMDKKP
jgi:AMP deaminase